MRFNRSWLLALLLVASFAVARPAHAQAVKGSIVSVGIGGIAGQGGLYRAGSWIPVQVKLENRSGKEFVGRLGVQEPDLDGDKTVSIGPKFILQSTDVDGRLLWTYYWPRPNDYELNGIKSVLVLDESGSQVLATVTTPNGQAGTAGIGKSDGETDRSMRFAVILGDRRMGWSSYTNAWGGTEGVRFATIQNPDQMPDDVKGLDGVDVIVWQADAVKPSDIPPEFQQKAMLEWVRAGGHLIISVGTQGQEFLKAGGKLADAMPLAITGTREMKFEALAPFPGCAALGPGGPSAQVSFIQSVGAIKPGARAISGGAFGPFSDHPIAVTGVYGRGAITVLTLNAGNPEMEAHLTEHNWIEFWNFVAGWQSGTILTAAEYDAARKIDAEVIANPPRQIELGDNITSLVDVTEVTQVRILVSVLFLAVYWLLAGPVGHLVLRHYRVGHWSWWIFGASVVVATGIAGAVVFFLHVTQYEVRHKSFVLGTVNSREVTVAGFYGVYAPLSGGVQLRQSDSPDAGAMNYLVPMSIPTSEEIKPFADPQSYDISVEHPDAIAPIFRSTLKKMQGRWTGNLPGIDGAATYTRDSAHELQGELVNNSGYDLEDVQFIVYRNSETRLGNSHLYTLAEWKNGAHLQLDKNLALDKPLAAGASATTVEHYLQIMGWKFTSEPYGHDLSIAIDAGASDADKALFARRFTNDLLDILLDARELDPLKRTAADASNPHREAVRNWARLTDSTKVLHAAGALIVARAGSIGQQRFVKSPVPLTVNGREVAGQGETIFLWALPVAGSSLTVSEPPALLVPARGVRGNRSKNPAPSPEAP